MENSDQSNDTNLPEDLKGGDLVRKMGFWKVVAEDFVTNYRQPFYPGFHALFFYRVGSCVDNHTFILSKIALKLVYKIGFLFVRNFYGIELERSVKIGRRLVLAHQHGIVIHAQARIGNDVVIRHSVTFGRASLQDGFKGPTIGNRVEFSPGVVLVGDITIGDDVSIGPNCTVTTNVPAGRTLFVPPPRSFPKQVEAQTKAGNEQADLSEKASN